MVIIKKQSKKALFLILFLLILSNISANPIPETAFQYNKTGNEYFKNSDYVNARLYYEKALKLYPNDEIYQTNNKIVQTKLMGDVYKIPDFFLVSWGKSIYNLFTPMTWAILCIFFLLTTAVLFFIYYFSFDKKVLFFYLTIAFFTLTIASFSFGIARQNAIHSQDNAIVIELPANKDNKTKLFRGQKVEIKERKDDKVFILTEDGKEYWVESKNIVII
jgi:tetratricopeptide (TPR) repeat protein